MICPYCHKEFSAKEEKMRSLQENKYYWGVIVKILSSELGYTRDETHEILKELFLRELKFLKTKDGVEEVWITKSTTKLSVGEFEDYLSEIRQWASMALGIYLPLPRESEDPDGN